MSASRLWEQSVRIAAASAFLISGCGGSSAGRYEPTPPQEEWLAEERCEADGHAGDFHACTETRGRPPAEDREDPEEMWMPDVGGADPEEAPPEDPDDDEPE